MLLVIDAQRPFVPDESDAVRHLELCVQEFETVIATYFPSDTPDRYQQLGWEGIEDRELLPVVMEHADTIIEKPVYNGATMPELLDTLPSDEPIYIAGFETDACVLATALGLFDNGLSPKVVSDACDTRGGQPLHEAGMRVLRRNIGEQHIVTSNVALDGD